MDGIIPFLIIVGIAAVIAIIAFALYRILNPKLKDDAPSEEETLQEELSRVLKPIEDDETAKEVSEYKEPDDE